MLTGTFTNHAGTGVPIFGKHLFPCNTVICGSYIEFNGRVRNYESLGLFEVQLSAFVHKTSILFIKINTEIKRPEDISRLVV